jgi:O-antigen/teichoic acid export membrane protein
LIQRLLRRAFNLVLRGLGLVAKFALVFALARYLDPADVGLYGIVLAAVTYLQFALGFDFYVFANRELIGAPAALHARILRDQGAFLLLSYTAILPLCLLLFATQVLPWSVAIPFFALLVLEHVSHEIGRVLIAMSRPILATALFSIRAGAWVLAVLPLMWIEPRFRTLDLVLYAWVAGALISCLIGAASIGSAIRWDAAGPVDWRWIKKGIGVAIPLLIGTLAVKGLNTFDRYWVESIGGLEPVAAYVLFAGIATAVKAFLDAGVFVFSYPGLIRAARDGNPTVFTGRLRRMAWQAVVVALALSAAALLLVKPLLAWIGRSIYFDNVALLYWSLLAVVLYAVSMVFHYAIYARHADRTIVLSQLAGLSAFMAAAALLQQPLGIVAVPMAVCVGHVVILAWKALKYASMGAVTSSPTPDST